MNFEPFPLRLNFFYLGTWIPLPEFSALVLYTLVKVHVRVAAVGAVYTACYIMDVHVSCSSILDFTFHACVELTI